MRFPSAAILCVLLVAGGHCLVCYGSETLSPDRYDLIIKRYPFGPPPVNSGFQAADDGVFAASAGSIAGSGADAVPVRLASISCFGGVSAAGLIENASGRSFILREGERLGAYKLLEVDPQRCKVSLLHGTNVFDVVLSFAKGQPTNIVLSAREPYLTTFRPMSASGNPEFQADTSAIASSVATDSVKPIVDDRIVAALSTPRPAAIPSRKSATATALDPSIDAELIKQAMVKNADGTERLSYAKLAKLRAEAARKARAEKQAIEEAALRQGRAEAEAIKQADEERKAIEKQARAEVIEAIKAGYSITGDFELTQEEADALAKEGFEVPGAQVAHGEESDADRNVNAGVEDEAGAEDEEQND